MEHKKSIPWFLSTLFWGAFNDNLFKLLLIFFIADLQVRSGQITEAQATGEVGALAGAVFVIPFLLFSDAGGTLADHLSKSKLIKQIKFTEIVFMIVGFFGFWLESPAFLYTALFGMAAQSAFFGPCKFSIIPELVDLKELSRVNGLVAMFTFIGIITGTYAASIIEKLQIAQEMVALICIAVAIVGFLSALKMENLPAKGGKFKISPWFWREIFRTCKSVRHDRYLVAALAILCFFWSAGAFLQIQLIPYAIEVLGESKDVGAELFLFTSLGIAAGSVLAGKISGRLVELGLVPVGAFGLAIGLIVLYFVQDLTAARVVLVILGIGSGFMTLPLDSFVQYRSPEGSLGKILAANNFINFVGILTAAIAVGLVSKLEIDVADTMLYAGVAMLFVALGSLIILPQYSARLSLILLTRLTHDINVHGTKSLPEKENFLLLCDGLSPFKRLALMSRIQEPVTFFIDRDQLTWWNKHYFRLMKMRPFPTNLDGEAKEDLKNELLGVLEAGEILALTSQQRKSLNFELDKVTRPIFSIVINEQSKKGCRKSIDLQIEA